MQPASERSYEPVEATKSKSYKRRGARAEGRGESIVARQLWVPNGIVNHGTRRRRDALAACKPGTRPRLVFLDADGVACLP